MKICIDVPDGMVTEQSLSADIGGKCQHLVIVAGALTSPLPCGQPVAFRYTRGKHTSLACNDRGHSGEKDHRVMAREEVMQVWINEALGLPHKPQL